jgi:restriction endonuclease S subunit
MRKDVKLSEIAEINLGYSFRESLNSFNCGKIRVIQPKDITEDICIDYSTLAKIDISNIKGKHHLLLNDVLITNRGRFSTSIFCPTGKSIYIASSGLFVIRVKSEQVLPEYLSIYLNSDIGQKQIHSLLEVMTIPSITKAHIQNLKIPVVDLIEQNKIVLLFKDYKNYQKLWERRISLEKLIVGSFITNTISKGVKI